jgi:hypothetical protein
MFHLWLTTLFNDTMIIPPEDLVHVPPGIRDILTIVRNTASAIYVHEPLHDGQNRIDILRDNLRSSTTDPPSLSFEDIVVSWFKDLLLDDSQANDETGVNNRLPDSSKPTGLPYKTHSLFAFISKSLNRMASMFSATQIVEKAL